MTPEYIGIMSLLASLSSIMISIYFNRSIESLNKDIERHLTSCIEDLDNNIMVQSRGISDIIFEVSSAQKSVMGKYFDRRQSCHHGYFISTHFNFLFFIGKGVFLLSMHENGK